MDNKTNNSETLSNSIDETSAEKVIEIQKNLIALKQQVAIYKYEIEYADLVIAEDEIVVQSYNQELSRASNLLKRQMKALGLRALDTAMYFIFIEIPTIIVKLIKRIIRKIYYFITGRPIDYRSYSIEQLYELIRLEDEHVYKLIHVYGYSYSDVKYSIEERDRNVWKYEKQIRKKRKQEEREKKRQMRNEGL